MKRLLGMCLVLISLSFFGCTINIDGNGVPDDTVAPNSVTGVTLEAYGSKQVMVRWTDPTNDDLYGVRVWIYNEVASEWSNCGTVLSGVEQKVIGGQWNGVETIVGLEAVDISGNYAVEVDATNNGGVGLVAYYNFTQDWKDGNGTPYSLSPYGTLSSGGLGVNSQCLRIDTDYTWTEYSTPIASSPFAVSFWVKLDSADETNALFTIAYEQNGWKQSLYCFYDSDSSSIILRGGKDGSSDAYDAIAYVTSPTIWNHVVIQWDGYNKQIFLNYGFSDKDTDAVPMSAVNSTWPSLQKAFIWGYDSSVVDDNFIGYIDQIRVYNRELTSSEISNLCTNASAY